MSIKTRKFQVTLLFTSTAVLLPKIACAQTNTNLPEFDSNNKSELAPNRELNTTTLVKDTLPLIDESEYAPQFSTSNQQTKIADLEPSTSRTDSCIPSNIEEPEFTKIVDLEHKARSRKYCNPDNTAHPEFTSKKIQLQPTNLDIDKDSNYILSPRIADNKISPFTTTIPLNGTNINHLTKWELVGGVNFGDKNTNFDINTLIKLNGQIEEKLTKDNILSVEQTGSYFQLQTIRKKREITITTQEPQTLLGTEIQLSMTGSCVFNSIQTDNQCTYTPGAFTDKNTIGPDSLMPTRILQNSQLGDAVTPESLAIMKQPGFQMGANGQEVGVDLFFPNAGNVYGNTQSNKTSVSRKENVENTSIGIYSTVRQIVRANDKEAVIGRTVRGFGAIANDKNFLLNSAFQLANIILPDIDPVIEGGVKPVNGNINKNLFFAANNVRLPVNSFTFYHAGIGKAKTPESADTNIRDISPAIFDSIWIGVSPVTKHSVSKESRYQLTSPRRILSAVGAEGGPETNINFSSIVNGQVFSPGIPKDFYSQIYLTMFDQDVNLARTTKFTEEINYYPHISITGNITSSENVWRYYGGMIGGEKINAYFGTDFTRNTWDGWNFSAGAIAYTNPDSDYYSQVLGNVSKTVPLSENSNLVLSTAFNYAFDRKADIGNYVINSPTSYLTLGARANIGNFSIGLVNYFGDVLPNSIPNTLLADFSIKLTNSFQLSAYYTPINESSSRSRYGAKAQWKLGNDNNSPTLSFSWNNNEYNFGSDPAGNKLDINDNAFAVLFKFGNL